MVKITVSEALSLTKSIRERVHSLRKLRDSSSKIERYMDANKVVEPTYDVKELDKKITQLESFLMKADSKIKQSNAKTKIELDIVSTDDLLSPLT